MKKFVFLALLSIFFVFGCSPKVTQVSKSTEEEYVAKVEPQPVEYSAPTYYFYFYQEPFYYDRYSYYWYQPYYYNFYYPYYDPFYYNFYYYNTGWYPYYRWSAWDHHWHHNWHHNDWNNNDWYYGPRRALGSSNVKPVQPQPKPQPRVQEQPKPQLKYQKQVESRPIKYYSPTYQQPRSKDEYVSPSRKTTQPYVKPVEKSPVQSRPVYESPKTQPRSVQPTGTPRSTYSAPTKTSRGSR